MSTSNFLSDGIDIALGALKDDPLKLSEPYQTVVLVHAAQGIINNGGLTYFFEANFRHDHPYVIFIDAYKRCGTANAASVLEEAISFFPFPDPHRNVNKRQAILDHLKKDKGSRFWKLDKTICGDETVWTSLESYMRTQAAAFQQRIKRLST